jgi:Arc/MetJ-type ribon-helix-helix transcriptional regulator
MINNHTGGIVPAAKIAITIDDRLVRQMDRLVEKKVFTSRSRAVQEAVAEKLSRMDKTRLASECANLVRKDERDMAEEGLSAETGSWPAYFNLNNTGEKYVRPDQK